MNSTATMRTGLGIMQNSANQSQDRKPNNTSETFIEYHKMDIPPAFGPGKRAARSNIRERMAGTDERRFGGWK